MSRPESASKQPRQRPGAGELTLDLGGPIHAVDHGGDGPPLLLVHGLGGSLVDWRDVAGPLTTTHHVWSMDLVGFGRTPLAGRSATVQANQAVVDRVIEHIGGGQPVVLVGNSMGGLIGILEASRRPERVALLVLVDPALPIERGGHIGLMIATAFLVMSAPRVGPWLVSSHTKWRGAERLVDDILKLCTADFTRVSDDTRTSQVRLAEWRHRQDEPYRAFLEASKSLLQWLWHREALEKHIRRVQAPTLLIHGDEDNLVSLRASTTVAALRPDWTYHVLDNTGHIPQMERPVAFVSLVQAWIGPRQPAGEAAPASRR